MGDYFMPKMKDKVQKRQVKFVSRSVTRIWDEQASEHNPFLAEHCRCYGYDLLELMRKCSFPEVLYLLFRGELPTGEQARLLETLMIAFINPGPRHPATRAAMYAGVGKTNTSRILPIASSVLGGAHLGSEEVEAAMLFIKRHYRFAPTRIAGDLIDGLAEGEERQGDFHVAPGFGSRFGGIDPLPQKIAAMLAGMSAGASALQWGCSLVEKLTLYKMGWLVPGVAAAVLVDLGFLPQAGAGLFQLICSPGLLAHGLELAGPYTPITAMPFLDEDHYFIEPEARKR
jgi:citrate synthase